MLCYLEWKSRIHKVDPSYMGYCFDDDANDNGDHDFYLVA